jgi:hypothetical protein
LDRNGAPQSGAKCYTYQTGTTTAVTVTDSAGTPLAWPVVADIDGAFPQMFYAGSYTLKAVITASDGTILPAGTIDPVAIVTNVSTATGIAFTPTSEVPQTNVQTAVAAIGVAEAANTTAVGLLNAAVIAGAGLATGSATMPSNATITVTAASSAETIAGTSTTTVVTPAGFAAGVVAAIAAARVTTAAVASTSGTAITFTGLPSTVRRITVMFNAVSTTGTDAKIVQLGTASGLIATGYKSEAFSQGASSGVITSGFVMNSLSAAASIFGKMEIVKMDTGVWVESHGISTGSNGQAGGGGLTGAGTIDRIAVTTTGGTDTFDAGSISIMYE